MRRIYIIGGDLEYTNWMEGEIVSEIEDADLVVLTGGEDISPEYYNEKSHPYTYNNPNRDTEEFIEYTKARELNIPIIGICRGAQFISCLAGGKLIQHQENRYSYHYIDTYDKEKIYTSSSHHQAQYPFNLPKEDYYILGWTKDLSSFHEGANKVEMNPEVEVEVCYYPKINALGIQSHPEYYYKYSKDQDNEYSKSIKYFQNLLNKFLSGELHKEFEERR